MLLDRNQVLRIINQHGKPSISGRLGITNQSEVKKHD